MTKDVYQPPATYSPDLSRNELLLEHYRVTGPKSQADHLGKEHLWALGIKAGLPARDLTGVFNEVSFPIVLGYGQYGFGPLNPDEAVDLSTLGLDVKTRVEAGVPPSPVPLGNAYTARMWKHGMRDRDQGGPMAQRVIRVGSLANFAITHRDTLGLYMHPKPINAFHAIMPELLDLPEAGKQAPTPQVRK